MSITPPRAKFELHAYGEVYDFSNCISNWKELEVIQKRDDTSGIYHQVSFPFEFVLDAYDIVQDIFDKYKYRAKGDMYIYILKDNWPYVEEQYYEPQIYNLDWTQYNKSDKIIKIDTLQSSLYDHIKAKNKIVYDVPVSEVKETKQWDFERIELENSITFKGVTDSRRNNKGSDTDFTVGMSYMNSEVTVKDVIYEQTVATDILYQEDKEKSWFVECQEDAVDMSITIDASVLFQSFTFYVISESYVPNDHLAYGHVDLIKSRHILNDKNEIVDTKYDRLWDINVKNRVQTNETKTIRTQLNKGEKLYFIYWSTVKAETTVEAKIECTLKVKYNATDKAINVDLIDPKILLQSLVDKMTDSKGQYLSDIENFNTDRNNLIMMSAAESIRGIETESNENDEVITEAQVHTSYRKFVEWMNVYGYEQHVADNRLTFRKRDKGFRTDLTAIELEEHECADLRESVNEEYLYSALKIGYNRKDIENTNVRFEFNGLHDYSTDLSLGEHILELISPYRADCYGIEFLAQERGKDSTDDKSDKDLFLVNVREGVSYYETVKNVYSGNYPNNTIFNGNLNPYHLMKLNEDLLGISVNKITFAASDSNAKIVIDGEKIDENYEIPEGAGLFEPIMYDIASKNIQHLPIGENVNGIVRFRYKGQIYEGFIEEVSKNPAWEMETVWILYKKKSL